MTTALPAGEPGVPAPIVAVRAESMREVDPEIAEFTVTVTARDRDRAATLAKLAARVAALRVVLDGYSAAIEKRETSRLSVSAESKRSSERIVAYVGFAMTTITVHDLDVVGEMMMRVADGDQVTVNGPRWMLRPGSPVYREARTAAITEVIARAREYAGALGAEITALVELVDTGMSGGAVSLGRHFGKAIPSSLASAPDLDLDPQRQQVYANVEARFLISTPTVLDAPLD